MQSQSQPLAQAVQKTYWYCVILVPNSVVLTSCVSAAL